MTVSSLLRHPELSVKVPMANSTEEASRGGGIVIRLGSQGV